MSPEVKSEFISRENSLAKYTRRCQISLFSCENVNGMNGIQAMDVTLTKFSATNTGCVLCGLEENDSKRKAKLNGKVSVLRNKLKRYIGLYWILLFPVQMSKAIFAAIAVFAL